MNCIYLVLLQISIFFIICIDTQRSWWTDELDDANFLASEQKSVHRHWHHHQMTHQSVQRKFMGNEAHNDGVRSAHDREIGSVDIEFRHKKTANRIGDHRPNKNHNARRGQRQKHNKNGITELVKTGTAFSIPLFYYRFFILFIFHLILLTKYSLCSLFCTRRVWRPWPFSMIFLPFFFFFFFCWIFLLRTLLRKVVANEIVIVNLFESFVDGQV